MRDLKIAQDHTGWGPREPDHTPQWLTTADVARMLTLSENGVRWLARAGRLASETTVAGQHLFHPREVARVAERRMRARLLRPVTPRRRRRAKPKQLPLFGADLQLVSSPRQAKARRDSTVGSHSESLAIVRKRTWF